MKAIELYENETGNKSPDNQISYHEWHIDYVKWLERKVVENFNNKCITRDVSCSFDMNEWVELGQTIQRHENVKGDTIFGTSSTWKRFSYLREKYKKRL